MKTFGVCLLVLLKLQPGEPMRKNQGGMWGKFVKLLSRRRARGKVCNGPEWKQLN